MTGSIVAIVQRIEDPPTLDRQHRLDLSALHERVQVLASDDEPWASGIIEIARPQRAAKSESS